MSDLEFDIRINESSLISVEAGCELLDEHDQLIGDIAGFRAEGSRIKGANGRAGAQLVFTERLDWSRMRVKPWMRLSALTGTGFRYGLPLMDEDGAYLVDGDGFILLDDSPAATIRTVEETPRTYLGVYVLDRNRVNYRTVQRDWQVDGYDKVALMSDDLRRTVRVAAGEPFLPAMVELVRNWAPGLEGVQADDTAIAATAVTDVTYIIDGSLKSGAAVVNDMGSRIAYRPLWFDQSGTPRLSPFVPPSDLPTLRHYNATRRNIRADRTREQAMFNVANSWLFIRNDPGQAAPAVGNGLYFIENPDYGPTSILARRRRVHRNVPIDAADQATFIALAKAIVATEMRPVERIAFKSAPFPRHWLFDAITWTDPDFADDPDFVTTGRYVVDEFDLPLDGDDMSVQASDIPPALPEYRPGGGVFTGGDEEYDSGDWHVHIFTTDGTLTMVEPGSMRVFMRGAGGTGGGPGSGSTHASGGGGAGEAVEIQLEVLDDVAVVIGQPGPAQATANTVGASGGDTFFGEFKALGGGGGGSGSVAAGVDGGSGGGGAAGNPTGGAGGLGRHGNDGGAGEGSSGSSRGGGGGGGTGGVGEEGTTVGGDGGVGTANDYSGYVERGGGGGGGGSSQVAAEPGVGVDGGGTGAIAGGASATAGVDGTGGGGGGGAGGSGVARSGAHGGSGKVVVSYLRRELVPY